MHVPVVEKKKLVGVSRSMVLEAWRLIPHLERERASHVQPNGTNRQPLLVISFELSPIPNNRRRAYRKVGPILDDTLDTTITEGQYQVRPEEFP